MYEIGDTGPAGGKIFYVNQNGFDFFTGSTSGDTAAKKCYYLEAAPANISETFRWITGPFSTTNIAGTGTAIGTGKKNTAIMVTIDTDSGLAAAKACVAYGNGTAFNDWFLPSKDELNQLYLNRITLSIPSTGTYWSSSQSSTNTAIPQNFSSGSQMDFGKTNSYNVRAVRAF
jgi:hypothetical protein